MTPRIGLFHATLNAVVPVSEEWQIAHPDVSLTHYVDEGLLPAIKARGLDTAVKARLKHWLNLICDDGADAILLTCSCVTPLVPALRATIPRPITAIDEAMIEEALSAGSRLGVVATLHAAADTTKRLLQEAAGRANQSINVLPHVVPGAFAKLSVGDTAAHDDAIRAAVFWIASDVDAVVLAQVSMGRTLRKGTTFPVPVLGSGPSAVRRTFATACEQPVLR